jgi:hypothetical protein
LHLLRFFLNYYSNWNSLITSMKSIFLLKKENKRLFWFLYNSYVSKYEFFLFFFVNNLLNIRRKYLFVTNGLHFLTWKKTKKTTIPYLLPHTRSCSDHSCTPSPCSPHLPPTSCSPKPTPLLQIRHRRVRIRCPALVYRSVRSVYRSCSAVIGPAQLSPPMRRFHPFPRSNPVRTRPTHAAPTESAGKPKAGGHVPAVNHGTPVRITDLLVQELVFRFELSI